MAVYIIGKCLGSEVVEQRDDTGRMVSKRRLYVLDGFDSMRIAVPDNYRGPVPAEGEPVALSVRTTSFRDAVYFSLVERDEGLERLLKGAPAVAAAKPATAPAS